MCIRDSSECERLQARPTPGEAVQLLQDLNEDIVGQGIVVFGGAIDASVAGQRLRVIGRQELESNKRASGHEQDLQDLRALARTQRQRRSNISPRFREKPSDA